MTLFPCLQSRSRHWLAQIRLALLLLAACCVASPASAQVFTEVDKEASNISFSYRQMGVSMKGGFSRFDVESFRFDPADPSSAEVIISIPLASIDAGYTEANSEITKPEWLDTAAFPEARFSSGLVQSAAEGEYTVDGDLSIKGKTGPVSVRFNFAEQEGNGLFNGEFNLDRSFFGIGLDEWADTSIVAAEITVQFQFVVQPSAQ